MKKVGFVVLFILIMISGYADIVVLKAINPDTGDNTTINGKVSKSRSQYTITLDSGEKVVYSKDDVLDIFRSEMSYKRFLKKHNDSKVTLEELEKEVQFLRSELDRITGEPLIKVRFSPGEGYSFYKHERKLVSNKSMKDALSDFRPALHQYEKLYKTYSEYTALSTVGIIVSALTLISGTIVGSSYLSYSALNAGNIDNDAALAYAIGGITSSVLFLTGAGFTIAGTVGRIQTRLSFVLPVEKYNNFIERSSSIQEQNNLSFRLAFSVDF